MDNDDLTVNDSMSAEGSGMPSLALSVDVWCEGCRALKQELENLKAQHEVNYSMVKEKIIPTGMLIKKYNSKCRDFDAYTKKFNEISKKLEQCQRDNVTLGTQLKTAVEDLEPLKRTNEKLEKKKQFLEKRILELEHKINGIELLHSQQNAAYNEQRHQNRLMEEETARSKQIIKDLEASNKKHESALTKLQETLQKTKRQLNQHLRRNEVLTQTAGRLEERMALSEAILKEHGLIHLLGRQRKRSKLPKYDTPVESEETSSSEEEDEEMRKIFEELGLEGSRSNKGFLPFITPLSPALSPLPVSPFTPVVQDNLDACDVSDESVDECAALLETAILHTTSPKSHGEGENSAVKMSGHVDSEEKGRESGSERDPEPDMDHGEGVFGVSSHGTSTGSRPLDMFPKNDGKYRQCLSESDEETTDRLPLPFQESSREIRRRRFKENKSPKSHSWSDISFVRGETFNLSSLSANESVTKCQTTAKEVNKQDLPTPEIRDNKSEMDKLSSINSRAPLLNRQETLYFDVLENAEAMDNQTTQSQPAVSSLNLNTSIGQVEKKETPDNTEVDKVEVVTDKTESDLRKNVNIEIVVLHSAPSLIEKSPSSVQEVVHVDPVDVPELVTIVNKPSDVIISDNLSKLSDDSLHMDNTQKQKAALASNHSPENVMTPIGISKVDDAYDVALVKVTKTDTQKMIDSVDKKIDTQAEEQKINLAVHIENNEGKTYDAHETLINTDLVSETVTNHSGSHQVNIVDTSDTCSTSDNNAPKGDNDELDQRVDAKLDDNRLKYHKPPRYMTRSLLQSDPATEDDDNENISSLSQSTSGGEQTVNKEFALSLSQNSPAKERADNQELVILNLSKSSSAKEQAGNKELSSLSQISSATVEAVHKEIISSLSQSNPVNGRNDSKEGISSLSPSSPAKEPAGTELLSSDLPTTNTTEINPIPTRRSPRNAAQNEPTLLKTSMENSKSDVGLTETNSATSYEKHARAIQLDWKARFAKRITRSMSVPVPVNPSQQRRLSRSSVTPGIGEGGRINAERFTTKQSPAGGELDHCYENNLVDSNIKTEASLTSPTHIDSQNRDSNLELDRQDINRKFCSKSSSELLQDSHTVDSSSKIELNKTVTHQSPLVSSRGMKMLYLSRGQSICSQTVGNVAKQESLGFFTGSSIDEMEANKKGTDSANKKTCRPHDSRKTDVITSAKNPTSEVLSGHHSEFIQNSILTDKDFSKVVKDNFSSSQSCVESQSSGFSTVSNENNIVPPADTVTNPGEVSEATDDKGIKTSPSSSHSPWSILNLFTSDNFFRPISPLPPSPKPPRNTDKSSLKSARIPLAHSENSSESVFKPKRKSRVSMIKTKGNLTVENCSPVVNLSRLLLSDSVQTDLSSFSPSVKTLSDCTLPESTVGVQDMPGACVSSPSSKETVTEVLTDRVPEGGIQEGLECKTGKRRRGRPPKRRGVDKPDVEAAKKTKTVGSKSASDLALEQQKINNRLQERVDREIQYLIRFPSMKPHVIITRMASMKAQPSSNLIVNTILQRTLKSECDLMPSLYLQCSAKPLLWNPLMADYEIRLLELLLILDKKHQQEKVVEHFLSSAVNALKTKTDSPVPGRIALCRMFTALCRHFGFLERVRVFIYDAVSHQFHVFPSLLLAAAGVWPRVLEKRLMAINEPVLEALEYVILKKKENETAKHDKIKSCLEHLCQWSVPECTADSLATNFLQCAANCCDKHNTEDNSKSLFELELALRLLSSVEGWEWTNNVLIVELIWPKLQSWASQQETSTSDVFIQFLLKVLGRIVGNCPKQHKEASAMVLTTLSALVSGISGLTVPLAVEEAALESLVWLAPFDPDLVADKCYEWKRDPKKERSDSLRRQIEQFINYSELIKSNDNIELKH